MAGKPLPAPSVLRQIIRYDATTGKLFWKERTPEMFAGSKSPEKSAAAWNRSVAGTEALTAYANGYRVGSVLGRRVPAHRVAWVVSHGEWPIGEIDHINGKRDDNRIENLRDVPHRVNSLNNGVRSDSPLGVSCLRDKRPKAWGARWQVVIGQHGAILHRRSFKCIGQAIKHRNAYQRQRGATDQHGFRASGERRTQWGAAQ